MEPHSSAEQEQFYSEIQQLINVRKLVVTASNHIMDEGDISLNDLAIISELAIDGAMTASNLAKKTGMQNSYISTKISSMLKQKLLTEHTVSGNRRLRIVDLTSTGKHLFQDLYQAFPEKYDTLIKNLGDLLDNKAN
ncbi:MarR family winged helix-turn-helix transcriptional regulator [Secundilactobacillus malefermentans]|uniref:HTH marR-type domain-containing protein n=1 Tax=Secundilactobacillus malefermentans TaxID=176292 RepID=A0A4R5NTK2_9LACO|nr:MarR family winged helix-turn-helix transcriptional regulator [Secundilactobacillus malefermentans]KRM56099.1 transcriptional regulator [Secundilactobacillus malefermentans DSM 5705 = KCTC 3548]QEA31289.1 winged helix-turn-helix transcriptional regulator [Secundilactobacillus malefermentans]TDG80801.1 hypothetical protein C5L31_002049 [Secundilactobacillus malefermentans]